MTTAANEAPAWAYDAVFYQIFPDRFARSGRVPAPGPLEPWETPPTVHGYKGGDLWGLVDHLDYLQLLGVTAIYLNPIFQSGANHRYHTHDYLHIDPLLGGEEAFEALVAASHSRGMRVILDCVFNHTGRGFLPFHDLAENGADSPYRDWFLADDYPLNPYGDHAPANYEAWWGLKALPKLNTNNAAVREYLMGVAEHWTRYEIDGWRLDVPEEIHTEGFWEEFRHRVRAINPDAYIVGEIWGDASAWIGDRLDGTMNYQLGTAIISFVANGNIDADLELDNQWYHITTPLDGEAFAGAVAANLDRYPMAANLNLLESHDTARLLSMLRGDRTAATLAALLLMTFPGAPCIYYGTEVGLEGGLDPDSRRAFPNADQRDIEMFDMWRSLVALRTEQPALRSRDIELVPAGSAFAALRRSSEETLLVAANPSPDTATVSLAQPGDANRLWGQGTAAGSPQGLVVELPPRTGGVWLLPEGANRT